MTSLAQTVADATHLLNALHGRIANDSNAAHYPLTKRCVEQLLEALDAEFGAACSAPPRAKVARCDDAAFALLERRLSYQQHKRNEAEEDAHELESAKISGRIQHMWFIRVGLAAPTIPAAKLSAWPTTKLKQ